MNNLKKKRFFFSWESNPVWIIEFIIDLNVFFYKETIRSFLLELVDLETYDLILQAYVDFHMVTDKQMEIVR